MLNSFSMEFLSSLFERNSNDFLTKSFGAIILCESCLWWNDPYWKLFLHGRGKE